MPPVRLVPFLRWGLRTCPLFIWLDQRARLASSGLLSLTLILNPLAPEDFFLLAISMCSIELTAMVTVGRAAKAEHNKSLVKSDVMESLVLVVLEN